MLPARTGPRSAPAAAVTGGPGHLAALDGLRALAAAAVLVTHVGALTGYVGTGTPASWVVSRGDVGVPIFFALSGLLLYRPWAVAALAGRPAGPVTAYLRRRALRILPAYWAVVLIALPVLNPGPARHVWPWVQYLLLVQNYDPRPWWAGTGATGLAQDWSLAVEVSFYLLLPVLAAALTWLACSAGRGGRDLGGRARRLLAMIAVLAASSFGWTVLAYRPRPQLWFAGTLPPLLIWFAAGMAIATGAAWATAEPGADGPARRFCRSVAASAGMCWLIAGATFVIACTPVTGPEVTGVPTLWQTGVKTGLYALIAVAVVAPLAWLPWRGDAGRPPGPPGPGSGAGPGAGPGAGAGLAGRVLGSRGLRFLGRISYGIFLWQLLIAYLFFRVLHLRTAYYGGTYTTLEAAGVLIAIAALTAAAATLSYYLLERPAQRLRPRGK